MTVSNIRSFTSLNRNEYAMSREDDFAQTSAVRGFIEGNVLSETELFRLGISADEPFRTLTYTDDPDELAALASQSTKSQEWVAYADGKIIHRAPTGRGAWKEVAGALNGYIATQRIVYGRTVEAPSMDKVATRHLEDLPAPPLSNSCGNPALPADEDRLPRELKWLEEANEVILPTEDDDFIAVPAVWLESEAEDVHLPYVEGISEAAALGYRAASNTHPTCD